MLDIVIIGAGPAGLMAGRILKNKSHKNTKLLIIDSKKEIGKDVRCGEGTKRKEFEEFFGTKKYDFVKNYINKHKIIVGNYEKIINLDCIELDREKFEKWLAKPLKKCIKLNTVCKRINQKQNCIEIETNKEKILAKIVIISTGNNFELQKQLGLLKKQNKENTKEKTQEMKQKPALLYGGIFESHGLNPDSFYFYFDNKYFGYYWVFPKNKDEANIGFGMFNEGNPKPIFEELKKQFNPKAKPKHMYGGILRLNGPIEKTYTDRVLVCGGAADFVFAGTGEGIYYALKSGETAGKIALEALKKKRFDKTFLKKYESAWKKSFEKELKAGMCFKDFLEFGYKNKIYQGMFRHANEQSLKKLMKGKIPIKYFIAWKILKFLKFPRILKI